MILLIIADVVVLFQRPARDDEGSVRQLRGAEDDRRVGADAAQSADAQDPAAPVLAAQVHIRQAHHRQAGEVLHEGCRRPGPHRTTSQHSAVDTKRQTTNHCIPKHRGQYCN